MCVHLNRKMVTALCVYANIFFYPIQKKNHNNAWPNTIQQLVLYHTELQMKSNKGRKEKESSKLSACNAFEMAMNFVGSLFEPRYQLLALRSKCINSDKRVARKRDKKKRKEKKIKYVNCSDTFYWSWLCVFFKCVNRVVRCAFGSFFVLWK